MPRLGIDASTATHVMLEGRELLAFGGCNYAGLAHHPRVRAALAQGLARFGLTTTASRETTGNTTAHESLERDLSAFMGQQAAILSAEGYTANFMACQVLARSIGVALLDAQTHRSVRHAARAAGMQVFDFEHLSAASAAALARTYADAGVAIMTDSVFAADGGVAPIADLLAALPSHLPPHRAALLVDDCHGLCVLGPGGRGSIAGAGLADPRIVLTTTLAKGMGCYGGAVLGATEFIAAVREHAWVYRGSTPVPPAIACAAREAIACLRDEPHIVENLRANIRQLRAAFQRLGLRVPAEGIPIFTFALDSPQRQRDVHERLLSRGILAPLIQYPGGPAETYFRVVVNAAHTPDHIATLAGELQSALEATAPPFTGPRMTSVA